MSIDLREFYQASDPSRTLFVNNSSDGKYYIDFSSVRGGDILGKLKQKITFFKPNEPTCTLFTGHIGCGKSTELLRLQAELEKLGFHVVYFESSDDLEMTDVDIADVLLAIARRVSQSLDKITLESPNKFNELLQGAWKILNSEVTGGKLKVPVLGDVGLSADKDKLSLSVGIGEITSKMKNDPTLREKLNQYLAPQKTKLLEAINQELLEPAIAKLKQQGKSPDGKTLASGSLDTTIKLWDVSTGKAIKTLTGHSSGVNSVRFSPDGKTLASGSLDTTIKLWDVSTGKAIKTLTGHRSRVISVGFSPDGKTLASGSSDKTVILWDLDFDNLLLSGCNLLNNYLVAHPEVLEELRSCQSPLQLAQGATVLVIQGEKLARNDDINGAVEKFGKAQQWDNNPLLSLSVRAIARSLMRQ
ncbi:Serine/threonine protein kinase [Nostoc flagelliforme CCNUN1]|uniref:Serine/threonine protein kinase n=1 Tax=Nostoc flagelliforme CCNUN1 TaxID=2038116 RepID=A0A2K8SNY3_9NOSO|nr:hypothetical protein [Nostoc flagelliforme]AUB37023.1 Serine/threonine protein kinase [Nostoc flagelliforme CCNUN1]